MICSLIAPTTPRSQERQEEELENSFLGFLGDLGANVLRPPRRLSFQQNTLFDIRHEQFPHLRIVLIFLRDELRLDFLILFDCFMLACRDGCFDG